MTALPLRAPFAELEARMRAQLEARMRAQSEAFDKSTAPRAKGPEFINFNKPGNYVIRVLPSRKYPADVQWFRKLGRHFIINVVTSDKQNVVQTAKVPQRFIKFLRTFQDMVNMLFCDPKHGNLIAFEAFPAANGFGNEYKMLKQHPMPEDFTGEQIPDLDELLKAAIDDIKSVSAFTGNLAAPLTATGPAPGTGFQVPGGFATPSTTATGLSAQASGFSDPFAAFAASPAINTTLVAPTAGPVIDGRFDSRLPIPLPLALPRLLLRRHPRWVASATPTPQPSRPSCSR
jgi:hypothetical protein